MCIRDRYRSGCHQDLCAKVFADLGRLLRFFSGRQIVHKFIIALRAEILCVLLRGDVQSGILLGDIVTHLFGRRLGDGRVADCAKADNFIYYINILAALGTS